MSYRPTQVEIHDGIAVLTPQRQLRDDGTEGPVFLIGGEETEDLERVIRQCLSMSNIHGMVLDFRNVGHMNSTAIGVVITALTSMERKRGKLVMANADERIRNILTITKMDLVVPTFPTLEEAIASLSQGEVP